MTKIWTLADDANMRSDKIIVNYAEKRAIRAILQYSNDLVQAAEADTYLTKSYEGFTGDAAVVETATVEMQARRCAAQMMLMTRKTLSSKMRDFPNHDVELDEMELALIGLSIQSAIAGLKVEINSSSIDSQTTELEATLKAVRKFGKTYLD